MYISSNKYKNNYKIDFYKQRRICPNCGKSLSFHIDFDFGGTLGVFNCKCGYEDKSYYNYSYATHDERKAFEEATKNIMW